MFITVIFTEATKNQINFTNFKMEFSLFSDRTTLKILEKFHMNRSRKCNKEL